MLDPITEIPNIWSPFSPPSSPPPLRCSLPFDFVKTRLQKMQPLPDGTLPYKGALDCAGKILTTEGPMTFYTGFPTYIARIGPHVVLTLLFVDMLPKWQKPYGL